MKRIIAATLLLATTTSSFFTGNARALEAAGTAPATVTPTAPAAQSPAASAWDPEMQRVFTLLAAGVLTQFIAQAGKGSLENFDPSALVESAVRGAVDSGAVNTLIDRLVDQASNAATAPGAANAPSNLSPEMRALIKVALASAVVLAKNEVTRSLKEDLAPGPRVEVKPVPATPSVMTKDEGRN